MHSAISKPQTCIYKRSTCKHLKSKSTCQSKFSQEHNKLKINHVEASASSAVPVTRCVLTVRAAAQWCQSGQQENSLPGPLLGQPQHPHPASTGPGRPPASSKSLRCCHSKRRPCKEAEVWVCVIYPPERGVLSPLLQVRLCEATATLPLLRSQELPTAHSRPAASSSTPHWQPGRHRHREGRGGGGGVLLSCSLTLLFVQPFLWPVHYRGNSWVHIWTHERPLSLFSGVLGSHIRGGEQYRGGQTRAWTTIVSFPRLNEVWKGSSEKSIMAYCHRHTNTRHANRDADTAVWTEARKLTEGPARMRRQNHLVSNPAAQSCELFDAPKRETRSKREFVVGLDGSARVTNLAQRRCSRPQLHAQLSFRVHKKTAELLQHSRPHIQYALLSCRDVQTWIQRIGWCIKGALCKSRHLTNLYSKQTGSDASPE